MIGNQETKGEVIQEVECERMLAMTFEEKRVAQLHLAPVQHQHLSSD